MSGAVLYIERSCDSFFVFIFALIVLAISTARIRISFFWINTRHWAPASANETSSADYWRGSWIDMGGVR